MYTYVKYHGCIQVVNRHMDPLRFSEQTKYLFMYVPRTSSRNYDLNPQPSDRQVTISSENWSQGLEVHPSLGSPSHACPSHSDPDRRSPSRGSWLGTVPSWFSSTSEMCHRPMCKLLGTPQKQRVKAIGAC